MGVGEPLPPQDMMGALDAIYFNKYHPTMPMIHKIRYYVSLDRSPHMRPPVCLRYAIWSIAASLSETYLPSAVGFYERARRYIEATEMKGRGDAFAAIYHAQAWGLIAAFEARKGYFYRSWVSVGRMVRITQMLGLHRLDRDDSDTVFLPPARDWIELEERRRTFWAAFYSDRWTSSVTSLPLPMIIDECDISTKLPASEDAFERGTPESTTSLGKALASGDISNLSTFACIITSAALFGGVSSHQRRQEPNEDPEDLGNGAFWKRHRKLENELSTLLILLPDYLHKPDSIKDANGGFLHMSLHASIICLHQTAITTAEKWKIDPGIIRQAHVRRLMAAEDILNIMKFMSNVDCSCMNFWTAFCLYVAGRTFAKDQKSLICQPRSLANLELLLPIMRSMGKSDFVASHFTAQLDIDIEAFGINKTRTLSANLNLNFPSNITGDKSENGTSFN